MMPFGADSPDDPDEVFKINERFFSALASVAGKLGVTLCLENMPFRSFSLSEIEKITELTDKINSPHLKLCFDTGHANMFDQPIGKLVRDGGERIAIIHVHDNLGDRDAHLPPYFGNIDWGDFVEALYDVGFSGVMNIESSPERLSGYAEMSDGEVRDAEREMAKYAKLLAGD